MKVKFLDLATGRTADASGISEFDLTDDDWSCDCNREVAFCVDTDSKICEGCKRYIVVGVEAEPMDAPFDAESVIAEANKEYFIRLQY
jgi:hypothetical protein